MEEHSLQHSNPIWRDRTDYIINILVPSTSSNPDGLYWEQLWARQIENQKFEIYCIPSFAYDLALGDIVETNKKNKVTRVVERSDYFTIRIWFFEHAADKREYIEKKIQSSGCLMEVYSDHLSGVSSNSEKVKRRLIKTLEKFEKNGWIEYETGLI